MYPRNAASPPRISIGAVVQISDGAVQTSGVSVVVRPEGGSETAGSGTISYGASSGIVYYTPTQAETDYTAFVVVAYKSGCFPVAQPVVTSAASTAGQVVLNATQGSYAPSKAGDAMTLTSGERTTLAQAVASDILNDGDGTAVLQAIADQIASDWVQGDSSALAVAAATRDAILDRVLSGNHDTAGTVGLLLQYLDAAISSRSSHTAANVRTEIDTNSTQLQAIVADTNELQTDWADGGRLDSILDNASTKATTAATAADNNGGKLDTLLDGDGYILTILAGAISNAGEAAEAYTYTYNSTDYAVTYAGLDEDGKRGTTVLSKP